MSNEDGPSCDKINDSVVETEQFFHKRVIRIPHLVSLDDLLFRHFNRRVTICHGGNAAVDMV